MDTNYKLVHSVDPTKCRPKIREKFAKLTLSSNKKKQEDVELQQQEIREKAMQSNISRNLMNELLTDDESDGELQKHNLLMRTDSSPSDNKNTPTRITMNSTDATHCSQIEHEPEKSLEMEPLMVSVVENAEPVLDIDDVIETLSSRVSSLAMGAPITISTDTDLQEISEIVSTETQRRAQNKTDFVTMRCKAEPDVTVSISSTSSGEESDKSECAITISDSSDDENNVNVSNSVASGTGISETSALIRDDRMAAFLRDVRRNYGLPADTPTLNYERRQRVIACADTEPMTVDNDSRSNGTAARIATADTESMTPEKDITVRDSPVQNINKTSFRGSHETAKNTSSRRLALNDTEDMTKLSDTIQSSPHYAPVMNVQSELRDESIQHSDDSIPEDSLTIAETSEEEEVNESEHSSGTQQALRPSASLSQQRSKELSVTRGQDNQFQINISAKINIKIQVSQMEESSSTTESNTSASCSQSIEKSNPDSSIAKSEADLSVEKSVSNSSVDRPQSSAQRGKHHTSALEQLPHSPPERDISPKSAEKVNKSPDGFMESAQRLLNELYGESWKTPQVMHSLKKTVGSSRRRAPADTPIVCKSKSSPVKIPSAVSPSPNASKLSQTPEKKASSPELELKNESVLDDFSIFRRNIPQNLDSTRLPTTRFCREAKHKTKTRTGARTIKEEVSPMKTAPAEITKTKSGREVRPRWRAVVDSDSASEGENASDKSWNKPSSSENDDKYPSPPPKTKPVRRQQRIHSRANNNDYKEDIENKKPKARRGKNAQKNSSINDTDLVYLDLSKAEVEVQCDVSASPPANKDETFNRRLDDILKTCRMEDKPKLECTPVNGKAKRKLFTPQLNDEDENVTPAFDSPKERLQIIDRDDACVTMSGALMPAKFEPFNKYLESVKIGKPIFKIPTPKANRDGTKLQAETPSSTASPKSVKQRGPGDLAVTPNDKYGFLKSLDACVGKSLCHPDALYYRDNFRLKKDELAQKLYEIYKKKCFNEKLDVPIKWNKKLTNTAGRCMNKKRLGERSCSIELSEKVLTSADRLRCTLIHELCHAATWIFNGEGGHGATWKAWARKANEIFPELPKIGVCHQYDIEYKYTYKCTLCGAKSHAHSKSKKVENIRCAYCHGAIEVYLNKKDKEGNTIATPVREPTGFAKFVKDKYKEYKRPDLKHADVMKLLSNEFASMKVDGKA